MANKASDSDKEEEMLCPLCLEELDITDRNFRPCQCGYQMCRFCWHHVKENLNGKCPACRKPYDPENYSFIPPDPEEIAKMVSQKKKERKKKKEKAQTETSKSIDVVASRKNLSNVRVIQRNLVYVTNLALSVAKEEILRKYEYFGQYGKIQKVVINKNNLYNVSSPGGPSVSAYVTYYRSQDALSAIKAVDGSWLGGRTLRASFGTTKYCTYFLKDVPCTNPDCMYLHELGGDTDSFTKEEMAVGKSTFHHQIHPVSNRPQKLLSGKGMSTVLPPPGMAEEQEEVETPSDTSSPANSYQPLLQLESEEDTQTTSKSASTTQKSAWKNIVAVPSTTKPPSIDPADWPKPSAAAMLPSIPPQRVGQPNAAPLRNSQERASALPPTASWAQKSQKTKGSSPPSSSPPTLSITPLQDEATPQEQGLDSAIDATISPRFNSDRKTDTKEVPPLNAKKAAQNRTLSLTEAEDGDPPSSSDTKSQKSPKTKAPSQKSQRPSPRQDAQNKTPSPSPQLTTQSPSQMQTQVPSVQTSTQTQASSKPVPTPAATKVAATKQTRPNTKAQAPPPQHIQQSQPAAKAVQPSVQGQKTQSTPVPTQTKEPQAAAPAQGTQNRASPAHAQTNQPKQKQSQQTSQPTKQTQTQPSSDGPQSSTQPQSKTPKTVVSEIKKERDWSDVVSPRAATHVSVPSYPEMGVESEASEQVVPLPSKEASSPSELQDDYETEEVTTAEYDRCDIVPSGKAAEHKGIMEEEEEEDDEEEAAVEEEEAESYNPNGDGKSHSVSAAWSIPLSSSTLHPTQTRQSKPQRNGQVPSVERSPWGEHHHPPGVAWGNAVASSRRDHPPDGLDFDPWAELRLVDLLSGSDEQENIDDEDLEREERKYNTRSGRSVQEGGSSARAAPLAGEGNAWVHQGPRPEGERITVPPPGLSGRAKSRFGFAQEPDADAFDQNTQPNHPPSHHSHNAQPHPPSQPHHPHHHPSPQTQSVPLREELDEALPLNHPQFHSQIRSPFINHTTPTVSHLSSSLRTDSDQGQPHRMGSSDGVVPSIPSHHHAEMQQTLRALLPNVNISFAPTHAEQDGWDGAFPKQIPSPLFGSSSPWGPPSMPQKPMQNPAWVHPLANLSQQPMPEALPYTQKVPPGPGRQIHGPSNGELSSGGSSQRQPSAPQQRTTQSHLPLPIPQGHQPTPQSSAGFPPASRPQQPQRAGGAPSGSRQAHGGGSHEDPWRGGPAASSMQQGDGKAKPQSKPQTRTQTGHIPSNNSTTNNNNNNNNGNLHGTKLMGNFQDPAIMMMGPQGMGAYGGNPWGLDPSYGTAYSVPAGLPPGLVMPLMTPQGGPAPPGFPFGGAAYARAPAPQPKSKYPSPALPTEPTKRPAGASNRRKN